MRYFSIELEELNHKLLQMAGLVESAINRSVRSLIEQDRELAQQVIRDEPQINRMEMEIDGLVTRLLALRQPVARDLRFLTAALKINTDLERIGDLANHIAERSLSLMHHPLVKPMTDIPKMASLVQSMLLKCLEAFVKGDADLARTVLLSDDEVDRLRDAVYAELVVPCSAIRASFRQPWISFSSPATWSGSATIPRTSPKTWSSWLRESTSATMPSKWKTRDARPCRSHFLKKSTVMV